MLELRNVTKIVGGVEHIRDVSLTLAHGSLNVLLGPTLSGKTSLMRLMAGLDAPTSGSVWFDGKDVTGLPVQKRNVAMRRQVLTSTTALVLLLGAGNAYAGMDEAKAFLDKEIGPLSTLSRADQEAEMQWFIDAAKPFAGMRTVEPEKKRPASHVCGL